MAVHYRQVLAMNFSLASKFIKEQLTFQPYLVSYTIQSE